MRAPLIIAGWGAWLGALAVMLLIWDGAGLAAGLLGGAALATLLVAAGLALRRREPTRARLIVESSAATVVAIFGLTVAVNGLAFGSWLILIGAEIIALGLAGLAIELRDLRRRREPGG